MNKVVVLKYPKEKKMQANSAEEFLSKCRENVDNGYKMELTTKIISSEEDIKQRKATVELTANFVKEEINFNIKLKLRKLF